MISAPECLHHAMRCEEAAEDASDDGHRTALVAQAYRWRKLGDLAKLHEVAEIGPQANLAEGVREELAVS